jgi:hypothetical protein
MSAGTCFYNQICVGRSVNIGIKLTEGSGQSPSQSGAEDVVTRKSVTTIQGSDRIARIFWNDEILEIGGEKVKVGDVSEPAKGPGSDGVVHWKILNKDWHIHIELAIETWIVCTLLPTLTLKNRILNVIN